MLIQICFNMLYFTLQWYTCRRCTNKILQNEDCKTCIYWCDCNYEENDIEIGMKQN